MIYIYIYIYMEVNHEKKSNNAEKILKNKEIQSEEFNKKISWRYNVSVSITQHQDLEKMFSSVVRW